MPLAGRNHSMTRTIYSELPITTLVRPDRRRGQTKTDLPSIGQLEKPKPVKFIYSHARLPLRVHIKKHDTTDSIITIVKTFFGIHGNVGVSFENDGGYNIIPKYENVNADTDIQVRLTQELQPLAQANVQYHNEMTSPAKSLSSAPWMAVPPSVHTSRPASRNTRGDISPDPSRKQRGISIKGHKYSRTYDADGLSDSDAGSVSVTSSRRDVLVSADISVENIVEGNRRKGAKFESSVCARSKMFIEGLILTANLRNFPCLNHLRSR